MRSCSDEHVRRALVDLDVSPTMVRASQWPGPLSGLDSPGLYSWWVDEAGAGDLGRGLEHDVPAGRVYAGQAGATRWPSGTPSAATLRSRITTQHLGGNIYGSTFRLTIAAALADALGLVAVDRKRLAPGGERLLTEWIQGHLSVAVHPYPLPDALDDLERRVLAGLDPPLNLDGMPSSSIRSRLEELRRRLGAPRPTRESLVPDPVAPAEGVVVERRTHPGPKLHEEIEDILRENGNRWMSTQEIADSVNARGRYHKRDGTPMTAFQVHGRTRNYQQFERQGSQVRLKE